MEGSRTLVTSSCFVDRSGAKRDPYGAALFFSFFVLTEISSNYTGDFLYGGS